MRSLDRQLALMLEVAREQDPSIEPRAAAAILHDILDELAEHPDETAAEVARHFVAQHHGTDASWVAHLARAAVTTLDAERRR